MAIGCSVGRFLLEIRGREQPEPSGRGQSRAGKLGIAIMQIIKRSKLQGRKLVNWSGLGWGRGRGVSEEGRDANVGLERHNKCFSMGTGTV